MCQIRSDIVCLENRETNGMSGEGENPVHNYTSISQNVIAWYDLKSIKKKKKKYLEVNRKLNKTQDRLSKNSFIFVW